MKFKTGMPPKLELLYASRVCDMKPNDKPVYRLQIFFAAYKSLGSNVGQMEYQRVLEDCCNEDSYFSHHGEINSGEYVLTQFGYECGLNTFDEDIIALFPPQNKMETKFSFKGQYLGKSIHYRCVHGRTEVYINNRKAGTEKEACKEVGIKGNTYPHIFDFCIENNFEKIWEATSYNRNNL